MRLTGSINIQRWHSIQQHIPGLGTINRLRRSVYLDSQLLVAVSEECYLVGSEYMCRAYKRSHRSTPHYHSSLPSNVKHNWENAHDQPYKWGFQVNKNINFILESHSYISLCMYHFSQLLRRNNYDFFIYNYRPKLCTVLISVEIQIHGFLLSFKWYRKKIYSFS